MAHDAQRLAANKQLILDYFREVVAAFDVAAVKKFVADDFVLHGADALVGLPAFEAILRRDFGDHPPLDPATVPMLPPTFVVAEGDLVTICFYMPAAEPGQPGAVYDLFAYNTYRIQNGKIAERWTNEHKYARPQLPEDPTTGGNRTTEPHHVGETDLEANKQLVVDFYDRVFGRMDPSAVKDFVADDYFQHASHMPQGRRGLEEYVAGLARQLPPPPAGADAAAGAPPLPPPSVLQAEGDIVVIAARMPQPLRDGSGGTWDYFAYDAYRVRDGKLSEHWSGIDKHARPQMP
jgi:predicted SnoaL-like aldol condensation-catalyzing enzyme